MTVWNFGTFILSFALTAAFTAVIIPLARRWRIVDDPASAPERKRHVVPIPLLGGIAVIMTELIVWWVLIKTGHLTSVSLPLKYFFGLTAAALLLAGGGWLDDWRRGSPGQQILWPIFAALAAIASGIGVSFITNPFGGLLYLNTVSIQLFVWHSTPYHLTLWADLFTFLWLMGAMYTTKLLDGLDGLVSGIGVIGALIVFALTLRPEVNQPGIGLLALSLSGACAGFLLFNWNPAKIFLGESGSLFIGFMLGVLSIISGGKIATALLILGLPILDVIFVIIQRWFFRRTSPWRTADRSHLHFRLLDAGLSVRQAVGLLYTVTIVFGLTTLFFHGLAKVYALAGLTLVMIGLVWWVASRPGRSAKKEIQ